jgi:hypothetical protein
MIIGGPSDHYVCAVQIRQIGGGFISEAMEPERRANADFIVKACNAHDELVKALEDLLRCGNAIIGASTDDPEAEEAFKMYDTARNLARTALVDSSGSELASGDNPPLK